MEAISVWISVLALIAAAFALYLSRRDRGTRGFHVRNRQVISSLQSQVKTLTDKAGDGPKDDLRMLAETLDRLAERAAREMKELKADATIVLVEAEFSLRRAVEEAKARLRAIQA